MPLNLESLSKDVLDIVLGYLTVRDANQLQSCSQFTYSLVTSSYWINIARHLLKWSLPFHQVDIQIEDPKSFVLSFFLELRSNDFYDLIEKFTEASSIDREEENGHNVLAPSFCLELFSGTQRTAAEGFPDYGLICQAVCRCINDRPCYWSSQPSPLASKNESLTFLLSTPMSFIFAFAVTPYQAFSHPGAPVYAPAAVCLELLMPIEYIDDDGSRKITYMTTYQSRRFDVAREFREQVFVLDHPVMCFGGIVRVVVLGMVQQQTLHLDAQFAAQHMPLPLDDYYACISQVCVLGIPLIGENFSFCRIVESLVLRHDVLSTSKRCNRWVNRENLTSFTSPLPSSSVYNLPFVSKMRFDDEMEICESDENEKEVRDPHKYIVSICNGKYDSTRERKKISAKQRNCLEQLLENILMELYN